MRNLRTSLIDEKSGNNFAVFEVYLPFLRDFYNLFAIFMLVINKIRPIFWYYFQNQWYEMVYVTKFWEIHQCCGRKEMLKGLTRKFRSTLK